MGLTYNFYSGISCAPQSRKIDSNQLECSDDYVYENCIQSVLLTGKSENDFANTTERKTVFCGKMNKIVTCLKDFTQRCVSFKRKSSTDFVIAEIVRLAERNCKSQKKQERESNLFSTRNKIIVFKNII
jgi:hypothetical protein